MLIAVSVLPYATHMSGPFYLLGALLLGGGFLYYAVQLMKGNDEKIAMKTFGVDANIVALSGIAIAIGAIVDMGVIICENILKKLDEAGPNENRMDVIFNAASEVGSAVLTAVAENASDSS